MYRVELLFSGGRAIVFSCDSEGVNKLETIYKKIKSLDPVSETTYQFIDQASEYVYTVDLDQVVCITKVWENKLRG